jgi:hypothetical protein
MNDVKSFLATVDNVYGTNTPLVQNSVSDNVSIYNENTTFADTDARLYGAITYLFEDTIEKDDYAYPFDKNNFTFPKKGETVIILKMFGRNQQTFYLPYTNTVYPNYRRDYITYERGSKKELESAGKDTSASKLKSTTNSGGKTETNKVDKEDKVDVNEKIKFLKPKDGDTIISGRAGNTIRFSELFLTEDDKTPSPSILIRNKQNPELDSQPIGTLIEEDINKDGTSIYITSNKVKIPFAETIKKTKIGFKDYPNSKNLSGDQLFVNSDRIVLSSKAKEFIIFGKGNTGIITDGNFSVDTEKEIYLHSNNKITFHSAGSNQIFLNSENGKIYLGKNTGVGEAGAQVQKMVMGGELVKILKELIDAINKQIYGTSCGPTQQGPANRFEFDMIKSKLNSLLSSNNFLSK